MQLSNELKLERSVPKTVTKALSIHFELLGGAETNALGGIAQSWLGLGGLAYA